MITTVIFSRDRACQLDLLLRSLPEEMETTVIAFASDDDHARAYAVVMVDHGARFQWQVQPLKQQALTALNDNGLACFLTDDSVFFRTPTLPDSLPSEVVCHSLRLGENTRVCYPLSRIQKLPPLIYNDTMTWDWTAADGDFGYPGSLDGHLFRASHLRRMLLTCDPEWNPNQIEQHFNDWCSSRLRKEFPLMMSNQQSSLVGVPINRVNTTHPNRHGDKHPLSVDDLCAGFLEGKRLSLRLDEKVIGAHQELDLLFQ